MKLLTCQVVTRPPVTAARSAGAGRQLGRPAGTQVDAWGHFLEGQSNTHSPALSPALVGGVARSHRPAHVSAADDQGGPVVLGLVGRPEQPAHADPPHHVPAARP